MPDKPPDFSDFKRFPLPTVFEGCAVFGLWLAAATMDGWLALVLFVVASLLVLHLSITALLLRNAARAIRDYEEYEVLRRAGQRPRRGSL
jgi:hypothetical protein